jgi:hypothetical protein
MVCAGVSAWLGVRLQRQSEPPSARATNCSPFADNAQPRYGPPLRSTLSICFKLLLPATLAHAAVTWVCEPDQTERGVVSRTGNCDLRERPSLERSQKPAIRAIAMAHQNDAIASGPPNFEAAIA